MSAEPFDIGPVMQRLQALVEAGSPYVRLVGARKDYAAVRSLNDFPAGSCYVMLATERASETKSGLSAPGTQNPIAQRMQVGLGIVLAFNNQRGLEGDELRDELRAGVGAVRNVLLGWTPVGASKQLQLIGGDLGDYDANIALWIDRWQTEHFIKPEISP